MAESVQEKQVGRQLPCIERQGCIYLDYNATTPVFPEVSQAMEPFLWQHFGNPSSPHVYGRRCKQAVEEARAAVATLIGAQPAEIVFTSCGTESDNWVITGCVMAARRRWGAGRLPHVVASSVEHPAVLEQLQYLEGLGLLKYTLVPVNEECLVSASDVQSAIEDRADTVLVSVMHSNNETGALQPIREIAAQCRQHGIPLHSDCAQSLGKVRVDVQELRVDFATIVGHKFGAPKGIAALYIRSGCLTERYFNGGGQESGRRGGTENVLQIVGLGKAAQLAHSEGAETTAHMRAMRDLLHADISKLFPEGSIQRNGPQDSSKVLPNTLNISIKGFQAAQFLQRNQERIAASAGAACHSSTEPSASPVLVAMKVEEEFLYGTLRLSTGRHTTTEDVAGVVSLLKEWGSS